MPDRFLEPFCWRNSPYISPAAMSRGASLRRDSQDQEKYNNLRPPCSPRAVAWPVLSAPSRRLEPIMIARFFGWLETRVDSFPPEQAGMPPATFWQFIAYYTKPFWPVILVSSALSAAIALIEVSLFGFLGNLVDWLSHADRATFWADARAVPRLDGGRRAADPAGAEVLLRIHRAPGRARRLCHAHPLAGAPLRACGSRWRSSTTTSPAASPPR